ncbi:alpha/beta hydrolase [Actinotignum urinale]|uniref:alpha/beta hydrolase n=1 Tax=Actinotignum urinale TaxID=190146 RepID=UPI00370DD4F7
MLKPNSIYTALLIVAIMCVVVFFTGRGLASSRKKAIVASVVSFLILPLLGVTVIGVMANRNLGYASDWASVYHMIQGGGVKTDVKPVEQKIPKYTGKPKPIAKPSGEEWKITTEPSTYGTVLTRFKGPKSGINQRVWIWVPKDYNPEKTYKAMVMLQGYPSHTEKIPRHLDFDHAIPKIAPDTIVAVPDLAIDSRPPNCVDFEGQPAIGTYITQDVVGMLRANYSVSSNREDWVIAGASYGGWCAPVLGLQHPQTFASIISFSGFDKPDVGLAKTTPELKKQFTVTNMMRKSTWPQAIFITGTKSDPASTSFAKEAATIKKPNIHMNFKIDEKGAHTWDVWGRQFPDALKWWSSGRAAHIDQVEQEYSFLTTPTFVIICFALYGLGVGVVVWRGARMKTWARYLSVIGVVVWGIIAILFLANLSTYTVTSFSNLYGFFNLFKPL